MGAAKLKHFEHGAWLDVGMDAPTSFERARDMLFGFAFYEPLVRADLPAGALVPGFVLQQHIRVGPIRIRGPVKITKVWDRITATGREAGFSYEALPGHVEIGHATFSLTLDRDQVRFRIESESAPANWFFRLGAPFARMMQARAVRHAFKQMHAAAKGNATAPSP